MVQPTRNSSPSGSEPFSLSIVIPAFNEEEAIETTIRNCLQACGPICEQTPCESVEVILVSDGSVDRTEEIARGFEPEIRVFAFPENRGYGAAIKYGFEKAKGNLPMMKQGALYPVLRSLEKSGLLQSRVEPSVTGPPRRYYEITRLGRETGERWKETWRRTSDFVDTVMKGTDHV